MKKYASAIIISTMVSAAATFFAKYSTGIYSKMYWITSPFGDLASKLFLSAVLGIALSIVGCVLYFKKLQTAYSAFMYVFTIILTIVNVFCITHFRMFINWNVIDIIVTTHNAEAGGFLKSHVGFNDISMVLCAIVFGTLIWRGKSAITSLFAKYKKITAAILIMPAFVSYALAGNIKGSSNIKAVPLFSFVMSFHNYLGHLRGFIKLNPNRPNNVKITSSSGDLPELACLIIGESEGRHYMGIYDGKYDSTPLMKKLQEQNNLFVFNDVISPQGNTAAVMLRLFSFINNETASDDISKYDTVIDIVKKLGYKTFWLTNQGAWAASYADFLKKCCAHSFSAFNEGGMIDSTDDALLPEFDNFLAKEAVNSKNNFFVFHLYGSHMRYEDRYPSAFEKFKPSDVMQSKFDESKKIIAAYYLNSILFTDYIQNEIIERIKDKDAIMVYVSDHGEELWLPCGLWGHRSENISKPVVDIPMFIYASDKYKQKRPHIINSIKAALNRPYMTDDLIHTICDLLGIKTNAYDSTRSIISNNFTPRERIINGENYKEFP